MRKMLECDIIGKEILKNVFWVLYSLSFASLFVSLMLMFMINIVIRITLEQSSLSLYR